MTVVAFTGTQHGMTDEQADALRYVLEQVRFASIDARSKEPDEFHHGDCVGADEEARRIAWAREFQLHCHPGFPEGHPKRARTDNDETYPMKDPLLRNRQMVHLADLVAAAPRTHDEVLRSGTWATIRYARRLRKHLAIIYPDGKIETWTPTFVSESGSPATSAPAASVTST